MELIPQQVKDEQAEALAISLRKIEDHRQMEDISPFLLSAAETATQIGNRLYPIVVAGRGIKNRLGELRANHQQNLQ